MAKFVLAPGEVILLQELVTCVRDNKRVPNGRIVITDRRVVLLTPQKDWFSRILGSLFGRFAEEMAAAVQQTHQIKREDFAEVEQGDAKLLVFRNNGESYAHVSFEVFSAMPFDAWRIRMEKWVAGELPPAT